MASKTLDAALYYLSRGKCPLPVAPAKAGSDGKDSNKRPLVKWQDYQKKLPTQEEIKEWWQKTPDARIGLVTGEISNLTVVDCDSQTAKDRVDELLPESLTVPVARTPRGGWHYYFQCCKGLATKAGVIEGLDVRSEGGFIICPPSGGLNGKGYAWENGMGLSKVTPPVMPDKLQEYLIAFSSHSTSKDSSSRGGDSVTALQVTTPPTSDNIPFIEGRRDQDLFHIANCLIKGGMPPEEVELYLRVMAQRACNPPFPEREISIKIQSAMDRAKTREIGLTDEVRAWLLTTSDNFTTTNAYNALQLTTRQAKKKLSIILLRLEKEGLIAKHGKQAGHYRKINSQAEEIRWWEADCEELPGVKLPLGLEEYVKIMPQTITVVAGSPDAGKTAWCLNLACMNARKFPVVYQSSEMDANELAGRLYLFEPFEKDVLQQIKFFNRSSDFIDMVQPDAINIIDYFEITDNFFRIAEEFTAIRNKLNKGIAVIALQKDFHKEYGRGASFSMEKPRLYLTVDRDTQEGGNVIRVKKAKNWRSSMQNPNGLIRKFWLRGGINIQPKSNWKPEV